MIPESEVQKLEKAVAVVAEVVVDPATLPPPGSGSPLACYHKGDYIFNRDDKWMCLPIGRYQAHLQSMGYGPKSRARLTEWAERFYNIEFCGSVAGKMPGYYEDNGAKFVVLKGPTIIEAVEGAWPTLQAFLEGLLRDGETDPVVGLRQLTTLYGWLQRSRGSLIKGQVSPQQALAIAGPVDCGKSRLMAFITWMLGGRAAKAHRYYSGKTEFNADLCGAEHHLIDDDYLDGCMKARLAFGAMLKQHTVSSGCMSVHGKGKDAVNLPVFIRICIGLNDEPENLNTLPPLNGDVGDKIILLKASKFNFPMPTTTLEEQEAFNEKIRSEIPAFLWWLDNVFKIPANLSHPRYGIATYHHAGLREKVDSVSPERALLELIDHGLFLGDMNLGSNGSATVLQPIVASSEEIRRRLLSSGDHYIAREAQRLVGFQSSCATYLTRLKKSCPDRVSGVRKTNARLWKIEPPVAASESEE